MHTLDRMLFLAFLRSYAIVLTSLLSLYVVIDLFTNLDDFAGRGSYGGMVRHLIRYYGPQIALIFDRLCESIALLAAVFTMAWAQRNNELLPQLSAGISTHRIIRPVLVGTMFVLALGPLNQELLIPKLSDELQVPRDDPNQERAIELQGAYDSTGLHIEGTSGYRKDLRVNKLFVNFAENANAAITDIQAEEAVYSPATHDRQAGWTLFNTKPEVVPDPLPQNLTPIGPRKYFLTTREVDFDALTRGSKWYSYASTTKLKHILSRPDPRRMAPVAVLFHMRYTRPLVGFLMVVVGLTIILRDHNRHVLVSAGTCLIMSAIFYAAVYGCKYLGENDLLSAPLSAWLPAILFGGYALASYDAIQT
ncbi:LptF/LptG family permease [Limnoglobus roseus]|uniref:YjgP/YjgQ family permease n=1 Tax=Limnoglobus roseus TaxID=2598579 RepID=A0A5C1A914_9BACT|nr:LptF/LptG family permease [Limnoglobus roseus]QEL14536.1 YjgP/YjgQ family permease [Limnoglobus roseus]